MTDDRSIERAARSWLENGPTQAPDHVIEAALLQVQTTKQERDFGIPWRFPVMNIVPRLAAAAAIVALAVGGFVYLLRPAGSDVTTAPPATPSASSSPSASPGGPASGIEAIPEGTYAARPIKVADVIAMIDVDPKLSAAQRTDLVDKVLAIKDRATIAVSIELRAGQWTQRQTVDGTTWVGSQATYSSVDANTIVLREDCCGLSGFQVTRVGTVFTLKSLTQAPNEEDAFAAKLLFESGPFTLVP